MRRVPRPEIQVLAAACLGRGPLRLGRGSRRITALRFGVLDLRWPTISAACMLSVGVRPARPLPVPATCMELCGMQSDAASSWDQATCSQ